MFAPRISSANWRSAITKLRAWWSRWKIKDWYRLPTMWANATFWCPSNSSPTQKRCTNARQTAVLARIFVLISHNNGQAPISVVTRDRVGPSYEYVFKALATAAVICTASGASADKISLNGLSNYLNQLKTAEGDFTQINDDGTISSGKIFIKRPGRMRFEYNAPDSAIVLASNGAVVIDDTKSNQPAETYPLKRTPLSIILARNVDLGQAKMVTGHSYDGTSRS